MLHTIGSGGITSAILAFETQPQLPIGNYEQQPQTLLNRIDLTSTARREYEAIIAGLRAKLAMNTSAPNELVANITPDDEVLVCREKKGWDGPNTFLYRDVRLSVVLDSIAIEHLFHSTMLRPYTRPYLPIKDLLKPVDTASCHSCIENNTNLVEIVHDENDERFVETRHKEYDGTVAKDCIRIASREDLPKVASIDGNCYMLEIKTLCTFGEVCIAQ